MKLDKICRTCLVEKATLKPLFGACIPNMLMTCTSIQIMEGDGFPNQICTQCLQMINRAYSFKQQCEKSDLTLRQYVNTINLQIESEQNLMNQVKNQLFNTTDVLQQSSFFNDIFNDTNANSFVDSFEAQNADLAETMQSLQTIAEQCLPPSWENDVQLVNVNSGSEETCDSFNFTQLHKCQFCGEIYKDEWSFSEHIKIHAGQAGHAKYFCEVCGKQCNTTLALLKHNEIHLIEKDLKENVKEKSYEKPNSCTICQKEFLEPRSLKKHLKEFHAEPKDKKHECTICGKSYPQNKLLILHMRMHTGDRPLSCETCGKTFALPSSLHKHRLVHSNVKKYECTICQKRFHQASNLNVHLRSHTGEKPFTCSICDKKCATHVNLSVHMRTHTGERPYKCSVCATAFSTGSQLKKHSLRHTGERPYKCWHCGKSFRQKDTRDTHIRYHTGERPYGCNFCPKKYIAASHLRVHLKSHTDEKKFECNICEKRYIDNRSYKMHMLNHSGENPFKCKICGKSFSRANAFNIHVKNHPQI